MKAIIRNAKPSNIVYLQNCDLKCFADNWDADCWGFAGDNYGIKVATFHNVIIGFVVYHRDPDSHEVSMLKLCVNPAYRRQGVGTLLLESVLDFARLVEAKRLTAVVPEYLCDPREPDDATAWLSRVGFRATVPILQAAFVLHGDEIDGIQFELSLEP